MLDLGFDLDRMTIPDLQRRMQGGELDAVSLTEAYLDRIRVLDPLVGAVLTVSPTSIAQAKASDGRRCAGELRGPMDGVPVLLKDNIDTADLPTTAGSRALAGEAPAHDAVLVRRLRAAGAVMLGKANLSEWSGFRSSTAVAGWSGVGGQTRNPHALDCSPSGSSSGPAAGVAGGLAQVAVGTETDGSLVCPAGINGVVGMKPTLGSVDSTGLVPISHAQDTAGVIARHVVDAALTLSTLQGRATVGDRRADLVGLRIGLWRQGSYGSDVDRLMTRTADALRSGGARVVELGDIDVRPLRRLQSSVLLAEFRRDIDLYLRRRRGAPPTLSELVEFHRNDPLEQACFGELDLFEQALAVGGSQTSTDRARRLQLTRLASQAMDGPMAQHGLAAIAAPTNPPTWRISCGVGDPDLSPTSTPPAAAGRPNVTVPAGFVGGRPVGVSFMAERGADARLLALAAAYERLTGSRRRPDLPSGPTAP